MQKSLLTLLIGSVLLTACGGDNKSDSAGEASVASLTRPLMAGPVCANGGIEIQTGIDRNKNGVLDSDEVTNTQTVCNGINGQNGADGQNGANGQDGADGQNAYRQIISLVQTGRTESRGFKVSASEIVAYDKVRDRIFTINAESGAVDIFNGLTAATPQLSGSLDLAPMLVAADVVADAALVGGANSIAVYGDLAAVAVQAEPKTDNGWVVFINLTDLSFQRAVDAGALPDMLTFTPDGSQVLVANEGEPDIGYSVDPEGAVSIIDVANFTVTHLGFSDFNEGGPRFSELDLSKMILDGYSADNPGNKATVAQSLEPEYITVADDGSKAYVALQENNAIAVINLHTQQIERIFGLGFKDHSIPGNEMDAGDEDGSETAGSNTKARMNMKTWPVMGIYMPDSISSFTFNGTTYLVTANEGDSREDFLEGITDQPSCEAAGYYFHGGACLDEVRVKHLNSRAGLTVGSNLTGTGLTTDANLGRLKASYHTTRIMNGNSRADGTDKSKAIQKIYAYGARSFSIWDTTTGEQVFDSGNDFERITANRYGLNFNNNHELNAGDSRSDDKGPEPEGVAIGKINGHTYAFIGLERIGGVMVYDISNPFAPQYVQYINNRDFTVTPGPLADAGDLSPEGLTFVSAEDSPNGKPYLIVGNEVSGTTAIFEIVTTLLN